MTDKRLPDDSLPFAVLLLFFGIVLWGGPIALLSALWLHASIELAVLVTAYVALGFLCLICFGGQAADPRGGWRGGWRMFWVRERRENPAPYVACLIFGWTGFWLWMGIPMAKITITKRDDLAAQLSAEDKRWVKAHPVSD